MFASTDMNLLSRIIIVLTLALLGMQRASACEHHDASKRTISAREPALAMAAYDDRSIHSRDSRLPCGHAHSSCCVTACGPHCSALPSTVRVPALTASSPARGAASDPARAGVTRAPPVRPPIV